MKQSCSSHPFHSGEGKDFFPHCLLLTRGFTSGCITWCKDGVGPSFWKVQWPLWRNWRVYVLWSRESWGHSASGSVEQPSPPDGEHVLCNEGTSWTEMQKRRTKGRISTQHLCPLLLLYRTDQNHFLERYSKLILSVKSLLLHYLFGAFIAGVGWGFSWVMTNRM